MLNRFEGFVRALARVARKKFVGGAGDADDGGSAAALGAALKRLNEGHVFLNRSRDTGHRRGFLPGLHC